MSKFFAALLLLPILSSAALADVLVAARTVRSQAVLTPDDVIVQSGEVPGALENPDSVIGLEARVVLYAGRPIRAADVGPAAVIERNQIVALVYRRGSLVISTEARALGRAGPGENLRVMNLASRTTVNGRVAPDGSVLAGQ